MSKTSSNSYAARYEEELYQLRAAPHVVISPCYEEAGIELTVDRAGMGSYLRMRGLGERAIDWLLVDFTDLQADEMERPSLHTFPTPYKGTYDHAENKIDVSTSKWLPKHRLSTEIVDLLQLNQDKINYNLPAEAAFRAKHIAEDVNSGLIWGLEQCIAQNKLRNRPRIAQALAMVHKPLLFKVAALGEASAHTDYDPSTSIPDLIKGLCNTEMLTIGASILGAKKAIEHGVTFVRAESKIVDTTAK